MPPTDPDLPADLTDLLDATLADGGLPGVLADWIDERSEFWAPLARALRISRPAPVTDRGFRLGFRYRPAGPGVFFWVASVNHMSKWSGAPADGDVLIGAYRVVPGRQAKWTRVVPKAEVTPEFRAELWGIFLQPDHA